MDRINKFWHHLMKRFDTKEDKDSDMETLKQALIEFTTLDPDQLTPEQLEELLKRSKKN